MAHTIKMIQENTGIKKTGLYGFSWTTFFFGPFPALFREDFKTFIGFFIVQFLVGCATFWMLGLGVFVMNIAWAFMYNAYYTKHLLQDGYVFDDTVENNTAARKALGIAVTHPNSLKGFE